MNDKEIMEALLMSAKGVCDLYMHGTIESGTENVRRAFNTALDDSLCMQNAIYKQMSDKGWYTAQQAEAQQINQLKQKYANTCC